MSARVAAIGLDSAEWDVVEALLDRGELPNLAGLTERGTTIPLRNDLLSRTSLVWEAFLTGIVDPTSLFSGAMVFDPSTYTPHRIGARPVQPFFDRLDGVRTIAFDVPYLSLATASDDVRITCWGGHIRAYPRAARPRGLLREIDARFGTHPAWTLEHRHAWRAPEMLARVARALAEGARRRAAIGKWLAERHPDWDLFVTVLTEAHSAAEWFGHGLANDPPLTAIPTSRLARDHLHEVYRALDDAVGAIVAELPDDVVVAVFSLHGSGANNVDVASTVLLPELLHRLQTGRPLLRHLDERRWRRSGYPPVLLGRDEDWSSFMNDRRISAPLALVRGLRRRLRRPTPGTVPPETAQTPDEIGMPRRSITYQVPTWYRKAWPRMRAFALPTLSDGRVRINLQGREADGIVACDDYGRACDEVERALRACRDPRSGRPIVAEVTRPRAADPLDPEGSDADLVIEWVDGIDALEHPDVGVVGPFPFRRMAGHTPHGFLLAAGPGIEAARLPPHDVADVAPTIVSLLGHEPTGLDGTALLPRSGSFAARA